MRKLVVLGGTGFLGSRVCRRAAERGLDVVSLSRHGRPRDTLGRVYTSHSSSSSIHHVQFDIFNEQTWSPDVMRTLEDATDVVHCMGTLLEHPGYKSFVKASSLSDSLQALNGLGQCALNKAEQFVKPLLGIPASVGLGLSAVGSSMKFSEPSVKFSEPFQDQLEHSGHPFSYERINRDSALRLLQLVVQSMPLVKSFAFISASEHSLPFPFNHAMDRRYLQTKRDVESTLFNGTIASLPMPFHRLILRPGFMYQDQGITLPLSAPLSIMHAFKTQILPPSLQQILPAPPDQPLHVDTVAQALLNRLRDVSKQEEGPVGSTVLEVPDLLRLSQ